MADLQGRLSESPAAVSNHSVSERPRQGTESDFHTLILGIGNLLWADEGFGVRCVEMLGRDYDLPSGVRLMDGGTQGLFLLPYVQAVRNLLIFDAVDFGLEPGELRLIRDADVPQYMGAKKVSMHQTGFQEVLAAADLTGQAPERTALIGVQPEELDDYGGGLRTSVARAIPSALETAVAVLEDWEMAPRRRTPPGVSDPSSVIPPALSAATSAMAGNHHRRIAVGQG